MVPVFVTLNETVMTGLCNQGSREEPTPVGPVAALTLPEMVRPEYVKVVYDNPNLNQDRSVGTSSMIEASTNPKG